MLFKTERLVLSRFTVADAAFYKELVNSPGWLQNIGDRGIKTIGDAEQYLRDVVLKGYEKYGFGVWKVSLWPDGTPIGLCGLIKRDGLEDVDIGFALLPAYEGAGYAHEAALATVVLARDTWKLKRIVAIALPVNVRSVRLLERIGLQFERMIRLHDDELVLMSKEL